MGAQFLTLVYSNGLHEERTTVNIRKRELKDSGLVRTNQPFSRYLNRLMTDKLRYPIENARNY